MTHSPPLEQSLSNLDLANQIRLGRYDIRKRIKCGDLLASRVLEDLPECMRGCGVFQLLQSLPGTGSESRYSARSFALLRKAAVPGHKRLESLTPHQLERLAAVVRAYEQKRHPAERGLS